MLNKGIVSWGTNLGTQKWTFRVQSQNGTPGAIRIEANGGFFVGNTVVTDAEWHHVAVTWANDGTPDVLDAKLYVDGVL
ncbi:LamG domain-containing protein, partial [bacterium]|nr:LamG domain-containing protein [bacterium]